LTWSIAGTAGTQGSTGAAGTPGTPGAPGTPGTPGAPGASATKLFAQVESNGTINASSSDVTAVRSGTGIYLVNLGQDITRCAAIAQQGSLPVFNSPGGSSGSPQGDASVQISSAGAMLQPGFPSADTVVVQTFSGATIAANAPFYLAVFC
jgi:hypothetical protein